MTPRLRGWIPIIVILATLMAVPAPAAESADAPETPWHISADEVEYDAETRTYTGRGNVVIENEGKNFRADVVRFNRRTMTVVAEGHVVVTDRENVLTGRRVELHLDTETGTIDDGRIRLGESRFSVQGRTIRKIDEKTYTAENATVTTCEGDPPDWRLTGRRVRVTVDNYGTIFHAALWARRLPVLYSPFFVFPTKRDRQSGLLPPRLGHSDRKGFEYEQPAFWAINESSDATLTDHYMSDRGHRIGVEYRYVRSPTDRGIIQLDHFNDGRIDDGSAPATDRWGYADDEHSRPNADRYWFRMKHDRDLPHGFTGQLDLDVVSDQDYLHEFRDGYLGFNDTERQFRDTFGRELDDYNDPVRVNRLRLFRRFRSVTVDAEARWYDDVIERRWESEDTALRQLPRVAVRSSKQPLLETPLLWQMDSEYAYYHRNDGIRGHQADVRPTVHWPFRLGRYATAEPFFGIRETLWYVDAFASEPESGDRFESRTLVDMGIDLFTELERDYAAGPFGLAGITHRMRPQVIYTYASDPDESPYPSFDAVDREDAGNRVTYSVTNYFAARPDEGVGGTVCRLKVEQSYDLDAEDTGDDEPFSPVYGEIRLAPGPNLTFAADAEWDVYDADFVSRNLAVEIRDARGDRFRVDHRYTQDLSESITAAVTIPVTGGLTAAADYERNLRTDETVKVGLGLLYTAACWATELRYTDEENDRKYTLMIHLFGLGSVSTSR